MRISNAVKAAISSFVPGFRPAASGRGASRPTGPALIEATRRGDQSMVVICLATGSNVDQVDAQGRSALHFAAAENQATIVHSLLSAGAAPNARDHEGCTPLHRAVEQQSIEIVTSLLAAGADRAAKTRDEISVADVAEKTGNRIIMQLVSHTRH